MIYIQMKKLNNTFRKFKKAKIEAEKLGDGEKSGKELMTFSCLSIGYRE